jgi:hypothetical protein
MTKKVRRYLDSEYDRCYSIVPLVAAGLSQTLATGSPAGVSSPIKAVAPQVDAVQQDWNVAQMAMQAMQQQADYSMTRAQTMTLKNEAKREKEVVRGMKLDNDMKMADISLISERTQGQKYENKILAGSYRDRIALFASNLVHSNRVNDNLQLDAEIKRMDISDRKFAVMYDRTERSLKEDLMREGF